MPASTSPSQRLIAGLAGVVAAGAVAASASAAGPEIVKQVDAQGRVIYSDKAQKGTRVVGMVDREPSAATNAKASPRQDMQWLDSKPTRTRSMDAAYSELMSATGAREDAERRLREAAVPRGDESIRLADGNTRLLRSYYERIQPFEREAMIANERYERAERAFRYVR